MPAIASIAVAELPVTELSGRVDAVLADFLDRRIIELDCAELDALQPMLGLLRSHVLMGGKRLRPLFCYSPPRL